MQIRQLHIDGFGKFFNQNISGFDSGLNIVYGENESGKTTLLEFIRRVFFGFNVKKTAGLKNIYPPLQGGIYGGSVSCLTSKGKPFSLTRTSKPGSKDSKVSILMDSKELIGKEHLEEILGHATENNFKNIYAFTLDELQDFGLLGDEHVKNQIYGAGLGLGQISLANVNAYFEKQCEGLFLPRGSKPVMNILLADIKKMEQKISEVKSYSNQFGNLTESLSRLNSDQKIIESEIQKLRFKQNSLQRRKDLFPAYLGIVEAQNKLKTLGEVVDFPESGNDEFILLKSKLKICNTSVIEETKIRDGLLIQCKKIELNEEILEKESDIFDLLKMTDNVRSAMQDKNGLKKEIDSLNDSIEQEINVVGKEWDEEQIKNFDFLEDQKTSVEDVSAKLISIKQILKSSEDQLVALRERKAQENSTGWEILTWNSVAAFAFVSLGVAGGILGYIQENNPLLFFSIVVFTSGVLFSWKVQKAKKKLVAQDFHESSLIENIKRTLEEKDSTLLKWRSWLEGRKFDPGTSPDEINKIISLIDRVKSRIVERDKLVQRLSKIVETEKIAAELAEGVVKGIHGVTYENNILSTIELLENHFNNARQAKNKRSILESKIENINNRLTKIKEQQNDLNSKLRALLSSAGVKDEKSFLDKHTKYEQQVNLQNSISDKNKLIKSSVGTDENYDNLIKALESTSAEKINNEFKLVSEELNKLEKDWGNLNQSIGEVRNKLNQLVSNDDLLILQSNLEMKKEKLNRLSREWVISRLATSMLAKGKREYETNRQPSVIKAASKIFSEMTGYSQIMKPLDNDSLLILDENAKKKGVAEMSRGTREQLYLSMRLGLIEEYESRSEPLPVVMDDVFVNFDDDRREKVIKILKKFSDNRQVIILSCHKHSLDLYTHLGANQVHIN